ncbi:type 2 isopentenyl-diphosphate Delta-isomerase [Brevibacillus dissolubilis]|uniref:type 2 isopentenyl-diphosphate Delta-isomerase n=1 Tax=Brevibacillus dissolubilis TaxID=1844116 RepID=UPI001117836D|nr:type 2 isopentenyl-diphosphate Delta-isomerase [Brevibacillus dissolubilis]
MSRSQRKWDHIKYALATGQAGNQGMDDIRFIPNALSNTTYHDIDVTTTLHTLTLPSPIIINAMTGGSAETTEVNRKLATLAREKGLAMAIGSQMAAIRDPELIGSYRVVRQENPDGLVFTNLGAEATVEQAKLAVDMLEADAMQIHLNVMQELIMPEGDRDFTGYLKNIERIVQSLEVPVIVKEVGFGMSRQSIRQLGDVGVKIIDVGGKGGTNFASIENQRKDEPLSMFDDWGLTTVQSLLEASVADVSGVSFLATGGIRNGLEVAKALALGASAAGMAGTFLRVVQTLPMERALAFVDGLHHQLRVAMTALGVRTVAGLQQAPFTIHGDTEVWLRQRDIDSRKFSLRGE